MYMFFWLEDFRKTLHVFVATCLAAVSIICAYISGVVV